MMAALPGPYGPPKHGYEQEEEQGCGNVHRRRIATYHSAASTTSTTEATPPVSSTGTWPLDEFPTRWLDVVAVNVSPASIAGMLAPLFTLNNACKRDRPSCSPTVYTPGWAVSANGTVSGAPA